MELDTEALDDLLRQTALCRGERDPLRAFEDLLLDRRLEVAGG